MYNKTKLLTLTTTILMLASVVAIGSSMTAQADHGTLNTFASGNIKYFCYGNLDTALDTKRFTPCVEFGKAATTWSAITNVSITKSATNSDQQIDVSAAKLSSRVIAQMEVTEFKTFKNTSQVEITQNLETNIKFNTLKKWGHDTFAGKWYRYDFQTIALHEIGHTLTLDHDNSSVLMKKNLRTYTNETTIPDHDKEVVRSAFT